MLTHTLALKLAHTDIRIHDFERRLVDTLVVRDALQACVMCRARLDPDSFSDSREPALAGRWLCHERPRDLAGLEMQLMDAELRRGVSAAS